MAKRNRLFARERILAVRSTTHVRSRVTCNMSVRFNKFPTGKIHALLALQLSCTVVKLDFLQRSLIKFDPVRFILTNWGEPERAPH